MDQALVKGEDPLNTEKIMSILENRLGIDYDNKNEDENNFSVSSL